MPEMLRRVYTEPGLYDKLLLPHYFGNREDIDLFTEAMLHGYGPPPAQPDLSILELGCGTGRVTTRLAPYTKHLVGCDYSSTMTNAFTTKYPHAKALTASAPDAVTALLNDGAAGSFDVVAAAWSLSYPLSDCFEHVTSNGIVATANLFDGIHAAETFITDITRLLKPGGRLIALFFDADTPEQQLVTRLWERVAPAPGGSRSFTRYLLTDTLKRLATSTGATLALDHHTGHAIAPDMTAANDWFTTVHCKSLAPIIDDPRTDEEITAFLEGCQRRGDAVVIPSGVYRIEFRQATA